MNKRDFNSKGQTRWRREDIDFEAGAQLTEERGRRRVNP